MSAGVAPLPRIVHQHGETHRDPAAEFHGLAQGHQLVHAGVDSGCHFSG
jgi:hypothetical protein